MHHIVITAKLPNLILNLSEEAIWQHLEATTTTPLKREWMGWVIPGLKGMQCLETPRVSVGCKVALCNATDEQLDKLVSGAVQTGRVRIR